MTTPTTFRDWVRKWQIGPGMNDANPHVREFLGVAATGSMEFLHEHIGAEIGAEAAGQLESIDERLYSGFDGSTGLGWLPLLDRLAADLVALGWDRDLHQVKEKFGGLRFYIGGATDAMFDRIDEATSESYKTCEECGAPGRRREGGWIKTRCDDCALRHEKEWTAREKKWADERADFMAASQSGSQE